LYRQHRGIKPPWFSVATQIYYDGYPRSGNTFLHHIFRNVFKDVDSVHHLHKVAPIKIALDKQIPVFILIRRPADAITSNYLKYYSMRGSELPEKVNIKLLAQMTSDYLKYYEFILRNIDKINIVRFDYLINNPTDVISKIGKSIGQEFDKESLNNATISYRGATDKLGSSKPSAYKQNKKMGLLKYLNEEKKYLNTSKVYEDIIHTHN
jgi:hypothetical protein